MDPQNVNQPNDGSALDASAPQGPEEQSAPQIDPAEYQRMQAELQAMQQEESRQKARQQNQVF